MCSPVRDHCWKRKLTGAHHCHFAYPGRRHRGLHSVHFLFSHFLYVPSGRWHPSVQTTVRAWAPLLPPCPVLSRMLFFPPSRVHSVGPYATTNDTALARPCNFKVTFRSRSLMNSGGRTTARVMVFLMASPTSPRPFFPPPLSPTASLQYTTYPACLN